jgi:hypothetical protein
VAPLTCQHRRTGHLHPYSMVNIFTHSPQEIGNMRKMKTGARRRIPFYSTFNKMHRQRPSQKEGLSKKWIWGIRENTVSPFHRPSVGAQYIEPLPLGTAPAEGRWNGDVGIMSLTLHALWRQLLQ